MSEKTREKGSGLPTAPAPRLLVTVLVSILAATVGFTAYGGSALYRNNDIYAHVRTATLQERQEALQLCQSHRVRPGPPSDFQSRTRGTSDPVEHVEKAPSVLITNAMIFTEGKNISHGEILLENGVVRAIGKDISRDGDTPTIDARGAWITPGLVNIYSHEGVLSSPVTRGSNELDSNKGPILPYLRSIDGFHTFDDRILRALTHGVTSAHIAPGRGNIIGKSTMNLSDSFSDTPADEKGANQDARRYTVFDGDRRGGWVALLDVSDKPPPSLVFEREPDRHVLTISSQSCNEATRRYGNRMDAMWSLRQAYHEARRVVKLQDAFCEKAEAGFVDSVYPESFQLDTMVDVLRGKVKVFSVCGEAVDLDNMIRLSKEFKFDISGFLLASEAWIAPGLTEKIKKRGAAIGLPGNSYGYSRETFRGSPFAPRILSDYNASVIMMTDETSGGGHIIDEARKAFHYGLTEMDALDSITSKPAAALGLSHRIGTLAKGADADIILWDSHPLQPGAAPIQVWIDGMPQRWTADLNSTIEEQVRGPKWQRPPSQPKFKQERERAIMFEGLEPYGAKNLTTGKVAFTNVSSVWDRKRDGDIEKIFPVKNDDGRPAGPGFVVVEDGQLTCVGEAELCSTAARDADYTRDLHGGSISPGIMSYGSRLGLEEFMSEPSTDDGELYNAFAHDVPRILQDAGGMVRAIDGLMFGTRHAAAAYRMGITSATSSLMRPLDPARNSRGDGTVIWGLSTAFRTGAQHGLEPGAILQEVAALHVRISRSSPSSGSVHGGISVSAQLAGLRRLLYGWGDRDTDTGTWFRKAAEGVIPFVVEVDSADIMASLVSMKAEVDDRIGGQMRMVFSGASEAYLLAKELYQARVGVILTRLRPSYTQWDGRRLLPGPPLSNETALSILLEHKVRVAIGVEHPHLVANTLFDLREVVSELRGKADEYAAYSLVTRNLEILLGVKGMDEEKADLVAYDQGSLLEGGSKAVAIIIPSDSAVDVF
ncbi:hypothetical protein PQX77_007420 [Marasmius sp. AFHP31]|nr:hypothetical protein PQX77_007420 [Marasmius sp. AFHP31]